MTFENWNTFLFIEQESNEGCCTHGFKKIMITSKLGDKVMYRGYACITCEVSLMEVGNNLIVRTNNKWVPMIEYMKQHGIINIGVHA